jgi:hypothetical protein
MLPLTSITTHVRNCFIVAAVSREVDVNVMKVYLTWLYKVTVQGEMVDSRLIG